MTRTPIAAIALIAGTAISAHAADAHLPLTHLTLYRSGVGSFTHAAAIEGAETFELTFDTDHVDDVLKSLLLLDTDKNATSSVSYQSTEDLARRLSRFSIDLDKAASVAGIFAQLRGVETTITTVDATHTGSILGVESRNVRVVDNATQYEVIVNLITPNGYRSVHIDDITGFTFTDEKITQEINRALQTLVDNRTDNLRDMDVTFATNSTTRRGVAVSYVHEMPVWKTSYRLVIPRDKISSSDAKRNTLTLQAFAIIENTTAADWTDVKLSLAAGRPVSFTMNLDEAIYANRPEFPVPVAGALVSTPEAMPKASAPMRHEEASRRARQQSLSALMDQSTMGAGAESETYAYTPEISQDTMSAAQSTGAQEGGMFLFTLDEPLNLESQQSAMLPIANTRIEGDPVSIYNANDLDKHPLMGVRFTNDTGLHLMPGPVTVFDGERYAGDAQIPHTSRGEDDRLTYALDLDVHADRTRSDAYYDVSWTISEGLLTRRRAQEITWTYTFDNLDTNTRTLLVDHAKAFGRYGTIKNPKDKAENTSPTITRELSIEPGESAELVITERNEEDVTYQMTTLNTDQFLGTAVESSMSEAVIQAMKTVAAKRRTISDHETAIARDTNLINEIIRDQSRIRNNMAALNRTDELYRTYYATLTDQENQISELRRELEQHRDNLEAAQNDLRDYLANLNIN